MLELQKIYIQKNNKEGVILKMATHTEVTYVIFTKISAI